MPFSLRLVDVLEVSADSTRVFAHDVAEAIWSSSLSASSNSSNEEIEDNHHASSHRNLAMPFLRNLNLAWNITNSDGVRDLVDALRTGNCPHLEALNLAGNMQIGDEGLVMIVTDLLGNTNTTPSSVPTAAWRPHLRVLNLCSNGITEQGARALAQALHSGRLRSLEVLNLDHNTLGDEGISAITTALSGSLSSDDNAHGATSTSPVTCPELRDLNIGGNNIGPNGARALAAAIQKGSFRCLHVLNLTRNAMGNDGAQAIAAALSGKPDDETLSSPCQRLRNLSFKYNSVFKSWIQALLLMFKNKEQHCPYLKGLELAGNRISADAIRAIEKALSLRDQQG